MPGIDPPENAVAWLRLPMRIPGLGALVKGLERTYGKGLRMRSEDGGLWITYPDSEVEDGGRLTSGAGPYLIQGPTSNAASYLLQGPDDASEPPA